ncbi:MAG: DUF6876 family protein [Anaerolineales bacterium]
MEKTCTQVGSLYTPVAGVRGLPAAVVMTDGAKFLAEYGGNEPGGAHWLMEAIAAAQHLTSLRAAPFQVWNLRVNSDRSAQIRVTDGQSRQLYELRLPFTEFPLPGCVLYAVDGSVSGEDGVFRVICTPAEWDGGAR